MRKPHRRTTSNDARRLSGPNSFFRHQIEFFVAPILEIVWHPNRICMAPNRILFGVESTVVRAQIFHLWLQIECVLGRLEFFLERSSNTSPDLVLAFFVKSRNAVEKQFGQTPLECPLEEAVLQSVKISSPRDRPLREHSQSIQRLPNPSFDGAFCLV